MHLQAKSITVNLLDCSSHQNNAGTQKLRPCPVVQTEDRQHCFQIPGYSDTAAIPRPVAKILAGIVQESPRGPAGHQVRPARHRGQEEPYSVGPTVFPVNWLSMIDPDIGVESKFASMIKSNLYTGKVRSNSSQKTSAAMLLS